MSDNLADQVLELYQQYKNDVNDVRIAHSQRRLGSWKDTDSEVSITEHGLEIINERKSRLVTDLQDLFIQA